MFRTLLAVATILVPLRAMAQPIAGLYFGGSAGLNIADAMTSAGGVTKIEVGGGPVGLASVGWAFGHGMRVELEGSYRAIGVDGISTQRVNGQLEPLANVSGGLASTAVMTNVAYDLPAESWHLPVQPYVGAGIGYAWLGGSGLTGDGRAIFRLPQNNTYTGPAVVSFGTGGALAYQAIAGAALPVAGVPGLDVTFEYRFFGTARVELPVNRVAANGNTVNGAVPSATTHNGFDLHDNTVTLGLRYKFNGF